MDLFDYMREKTQEQESPLASRMRPQTLEEVVGQQHIIGKDKLLYRAIKADKLGSIIFYGPPGTGKTTLAKEAGARVVGTGRSDFPNQVNNVVAFPGIFKGALEGRATQITEEMKLATANAIASLVSDEELNENNILPEAFDSRVADVVSKAVKELI